MRIIYILIILLIFSNILLIANDNLFPRYGLFMDYVFNSHSPNFRTLPECQSCSPGYTSGYGSGVSFGAIIEQPIYNNLLFMGRFGLYNLNGLLKRTESTQVLTDTTLVAGEFTHNLDTKLSIIALESGMNYRIFHNLFVCTSLNAGFFTTNTYHQSEQITQPTDKGVFTDSKSRTRNDTSGTIQQKSSLNLSLMFGLSYELPLNRDETLLFVPEISYRYGLTNIVSSLNWKVNSFNLGIVLKYSLNTYKKEIDTIYEFKKEIKIDTIFVELKKPIKSFSKGLETKTNSKVFKNNEILTTYDYYHRTDTIFTKIIGEVKIQIFAQNVDGKIEKATKVQINQQFVFQAFPLLPYIFFDSKSSELNSKYNLKTGMDLFNVDNLTVNPIEYHDNILNIIGLRMRQNSSAILNLKGFNDPTTEGNDYKIANARERNIKEYLINVWGISRERINLTNNRKSCLPVNQTKTLTEEGYSENRRVEIESDNSVILAPIAKKRYLDAPTFNPPKLIFDPSGTTVENIDSWKLEVFQENGAKIFEQSGLGNITKITEELNEDQANKVINGKNIIAKITVIQNRDTILGKDVISVQKDTSDFEIERLSLALFYVSGTILRNVDKKAINQFTKDLRTSDSITVTGYTDLLGNPEENLMLASKRSETVCNYIRDIKKEEHMEVLISTCNGEAFNKKPPQIHSYDTPEERFLSRTVQIEIKRRRR